MDDTPKSCPPHEFAEYMVCRRCGETEAALTSCHHCNEVNPGQRCWWCLRVQQPSALTAEEQAAYERLGRVLTIPKLIRVSVYVDDVVLLRDACERLAQEIAPLREIKAYWKQGDWVLATDHRKVEALAARYKAALEETRELMRIFDEADKRYPRPSIWRVLKQILAAALTEEPRP